MSKQSTRKLMKDMEKKFLEKLQRFDIFHDHGFITGTDSYWIVFIDNDEKMKGGRLGPFNTICNLKVLHHMEYVGNLKKDKKLGDLWKSNPPVNFNLF